MKTFVSVGILFVASLVLASGLSAGEIVDRIVGMANGEVVTQFELDRQAGPVLRQAMQERGEAEDPEKILEIKRQVLQRMLDNILIVQESQRLGMSVSKVEVDNQIQRMKQSQGLTDEQFDRQLTVEGLCREDLEAEIKKDLLRKRLLGAMVAKKVVVTTEEIQGYYDSHQEDFRVDKAVDVSLIVLDEHPLITIEALRQSIVSGELVFEQAARMYSVGPASEMGGRLGVLKWRDLSENWREALSTLKPGEVSQPFTLEEQMAIILVNDLVLGTVRPLEEVRDNIQQFLYTTKFESQLQEYLERLRSKAVVDNRL